MKKRFLITGGCGSIGHSLSKTLLNSGHLVCSFDISEDGLFRQNQRFFNDYGSNYKPFLGDIRDKDRLTQALNNVDYVYHCAALKHVAICEYNPFEALKTNVIGTNNLLQACIDSGVMKLVFASSDKAVNPTSTMGATKLLAEKLVLSSNNYVGNSLFKASSVRFGNVWGSSGSVGLIFKDQCDHNKPITVTSADMTRGGVCIDNRPLILRDFMYENYIVEKQREAPQSDPFPYHGQVAIDLCSGHIAEKSNLDFAQSTELLLSILRLVPSLQTSRAIVQSNLEGGNFYSEIVADNISTLSFSNFQASYSKYFVSAKSLRQIFLYFLHFVYGRLHILRRVISHSKEFIFRSKS